MASLSAPVAKALPPSIAPNPRDLAVINSWELTSDKIGRSDRPLQPRKTARRAGTGTV